MLSSRRPGSIELFDVAASMGDAARDSATAHASRVHRSALDTCRAGCIAIPLKLSTMLIMVTVIAVLLAVVRLCGLDGVVLIGLLGLALVIRKRAMIVVFLAYSIIFPLVFLEFGSINRVLARRSGATPIESDFDGLALISSTWIGWIVGVTLSVVIAAIRAVCPRNSQNRSKPEMPMHGPDKSTDDRPWS